MRALVTGAGGFIGYHTARHLAGAGHAVCGITRRPLDVARALPEVSWAPLELPSAELAPLVRRFRPDLIVHAAGTSNVGQSVAEPLIDFERSVGVLAHLLDVVRRETPACRVVFLSSAAVYGNPARLPISEADACAPISPYGHHKVMAERLGAYYSQLYGVPFCSLRIFSAYGPGLSRQVLWDICQKSLHHDVVELMGTGTESRDFIHVDDVARAIALVAERDSFAASVYNLASGVSTTIAEVAAQIVELTGRRNRVVFNGVQRSGDPRNWQASVGGLAALGFAPGLTLDEGLASYVGWVVAQRGALASWRGAP